MLDEQYLIDGIKSRDKIVFDFVFHYYYSGLCAYAERILKDEKTAEDIVQDLFVNLWIKHQKLQINASLKNYLFISVKNRSLDFLKSEKMREKSRALFPRESELSENLSSFWFAESELQEIVEKSLKKLPPRCREIFKLSRFKGLKNHEIANLMGISKRTVELQISNALKLLRVDLKPFLPFFLLMFLLK